MNIKNVFEAHELEKEIVNYKTKGNVSNEFNNKAIKKLGISGIGVIQYILNDFGW